jgi:hypothetical protein
VFTVIIFPNMTGETIQPHDPNRAVYDHFVKIKNEREDYAEFNKVPFLPDELHNLEVVRLPYSDDLEKTNYFAGMTPWLLSGYDNFTSSVLPELERIVDSYELAELLKSQGLIICFNHIFFADEPEAHTGMHQALTNAGVYSDWQAAADHSYTLSSRMVDVLGVDVTRDDKVGHDSVVYNGLRHVGHVIRTLPSSANGRNIKGLDPKVRTTHNEQTRSEINEAAGRAGNVLYIAGGGAHDLLVKNGTELVIQTPGRETIVLLLEAKAPILYLAIKCKPDVNKGQIIPDEQTFIEAVGLDYEPTGNSIREGYAKIGQKIWERLPGMKDYELLDKVSSMTERSI